MGQDKSRAAAFCAFLARKATYRLMLTARALKIVEAVTRIRPRVHERLMPVSRFASESVASIADSLYAELFQRPQIYDDAISWSAIQVGIVEAFARLNGGVNHATAQQFAF